MPPSRLDAVYRSILLTKFFTKGWGNPENLRRIFKFRKVVANREACYKLIPRDYPVKITKDEEWSDCHVLEGQFESPFEKNLPGIMPEETKTAHFQMILPKHWESQKMKPVCLHLAGTGDHYFWRRRNLVAKPLLKESGIASILLENPFYGLRKPKDQIRSSLHNVSDIFIMGGCLIMESIVILNWLEQQGFGPLGLTGLSMGGHMASLAATNWPKPIPLVPCLSWSTASPVFTQGVMSASINWALLESQYFENEAYQNDLAKMVKIVNQDDAFLAGQHFAKHFPASMKRFHKIKTESKDSVDQKPTSNSTYGNGNGNGVTENQQLAEEKAAATLFPLSLISSKFKNAQPDVLKGVCLLPVSKHPLFSDDKWREREALQFMRGIMDECTHLSNFEVPVDTELIIAVCARDDAYVPRDDCIGLEQIWPGAEIRFVDAGHVSAYLLYQKMFRSTIAEAFQRYLKKYPIDNS
ncbi:protein ABHD18 isoform X1 [Nasonia vitripennis]|uniref:Protein ABHD18 n=1 Tax=Nasonia vitripennis TaxID=7425 RepID=A0A7M7HCU5_NASVI|nr:protein ABHD18 isoform X1 [Nasonia vitripennis]XP_031783330.1 protein ABHD18 isoform X1 [Nasonia vitripennis]